MRIDPFSCEEWMNAHEREAKDNLGETCVSPFSLAELEDLADFSLSRDARDLRFTYGDITGSFALKTAIADFYRERGVTVLSLEAITATHGGSGANALVHEVLAEPGDEFIVFTPCYQQHLSLPRAHGAIVKEVSLLSPTAREDFKRALSPRTKAVVLTNPGNPLGNVFTKEDLTELVALIRPYGCYLVADEVYLGLAPRAVPSVIALYEKAISIFSFSKSFSLAGLRLGAVIGPVDVIDRVNAHRDYSLISCACLEDWLGVRALSVRDAITARAMSITSANREVLTRIVARTARLSFAMTPVAGSVALVSYEDARDSVSLATWLLEHEGILVVPGDAFGVPKTFRVGYGFAGEGFAQAFSRLAGHFS